MSNFAYVDPGSGLLVWQTVIAACVGCLFYLKKIRGFAAKLGKKFLRKD